MTQLINELTQEHEAIINNLNQIKLLGVTSVEGQKKLHLTKNSLLSHLQKEDHKLYPTLKKASQNNPALAHTLDLFGKDMDNISKSALDFFAKYSNGGTGVEFAKDFGKLVGILTMRIKKEENIIYRKYSEVI